MGSTLLVLLALGTFSWLLLRGRDGSGEAESRPKPLVVTGDSVWLLGDSLGVGIAPGLVERAGRIGAVVMSTTRVGAATLWGSVQAKGSAGNEKDLWLVVLGANDAATPTPSKSFRAWVRSIRDEANARNARLVWLIAPNGGGLPSYGEIFSTVVDEVNSIEPPRDLEFAKDRVHLTATSYDAWAEHVWTALQTHREESVS